MGRAFLVQVAALQVRRGIVRWVNRAAQYDFKTVRDEKPQVQVIRIVCPATGPANHVSFSDAEVKIF